MTQNQKPDLHRRQCGQGSEEQAALGDRSGEEAGGPWGASPVAPSQADSLCCTYFSYILVLHHHFRGEPRLCARPGRTLRPLQKCWEA